VWTNIPGLPQYDSYEQLEAANAWSKPEAFGVFPFGTMAGSRFNSRRPMLLDSGYSKVA
jgi:hypothetical protein